jgi:aminoglycoside 6-adenylyltransferase
VSVDAFLARVVRWARERPDVHGALLIGSQARSETPADRWSDVDLVLVVDRPEPYLADASWVEAFGQPLLTLLEETPVAQTVERRVLYEDGLDVDFTLLALASLREAAADPGVGAVLGRGHRVLVDEVGIAELVAGAAPAAPAPPDGRALAGLGADFWYHALWAAKKLARGELLTATRSVNGYLKERLIVLAGWHARAGDSALDTWHETRFFERWADPRAVAFLREAYARYERDELVRALGATMDVFELFERETAARLGLAAPPPRDPVRALAMAALAAEDGVSAPSRLP